MYRCGLPYVLAARLPEIAAKRAQRDVSSPTVRDRLTLHLHDIQGVSVLTSLAMHTRFALPESSDSFFIVH